MTAEAKKGSSLLWKDILLAACSVLFTLAVVIAVIETGVRLFPEKFAGNKWYLGGNHPRGLVQGDPELLYGLTPGFRSREINVFGDFDVPVEINSLGLRDFERDLAACTETIIGLGDSYAFGEGVTLDNTYLSLIEKKLNADGSGKTCVIKAGVPGYAINHMSFMYRKLGTAIPHRLAIVSIIDDDLLRLDQGFTEFNGWLVHEGWKPILQACDDGSIHVRKQRLNGLHHFLSCRSFSYGWLMERVLPWGDKRTLGETLLPDMEPAGPVAPSRKSAAQYFLDMKSISEKNGAELLVTALCFDNPDLARFLRENRVGYLPIPCRKQWRFEHDWHFNELGHAQVADIMYEAVLRSLGSRERKAK